MSGREPGKVDVFDFAVSLQAEFRDPRTARQHMPSETRSFKADSTGSGGWKAAMEGEIRLPACATIMARQRS